VLLDRSIQSVSDPAVEFFFFSYTKSKFLTESQGRCEPDRKPPQQRAVQIALQGPTQ